MRYEFWNKESLVSQTKALTKAQSEGAAPSSNPRAESIFHAGNLLGVLNAVAIIANEAAHLMQSTQVLCLYALTALANYHDQQTYAALSLVNAHPMDDAQSPLLAAPSA